MDSNLNYNKEFLNELKENINSNEQQRQQNEENLQQQPNVQPLQNLHNQQQ